MPLFLKHGLLAVGLALWLVGLFNQLHSFETTATYLTISLLLVVIAGLRAPIPVRLRRDPRDREPPR